MGTESPILTQEGAVSEKSAGNDVDYAAKSRMARRRQVFIGDCDFGVIWHC
jgi:hypothetical protein